MSGRPFSELADTGLLWLINRVVFHPRGFALALTFDAEGAATGWTLMGDGSEVWTFPADMDETPLLARVNELLGG